MLHQKWMFDIPSINVIRLLQRTWRSTEKQIEWSKEWGSCANDDFYYKTTSSILETKHAKWICKKTILRTKHQQKFKSLTFWNRVFLKPNCNQGCHRRSSSDYFFVKGFCNSHLPPPLPRPSKKKNCSCLFRFFWVDLCDLDVMSTPKIAFVLTSLNRPLQQ